MTTVLLSEEIYHPEKVENWEVWKSRLEVDPMVFLQVFRSCDVDSLREFVHTSGVFKGAVKAAALKELQALQMQHTKELFDTGEPPHKPLVDICGKGKSPLASREAYMDFLKYLLLRRRAYKTRQEIREDRALKLEEEKENKRLADEAQVRADAAEKERLERELRVKKENVERAKRAEADKLKKDLAEQRKRDKEQEQEKERARAAKEEEERNRVREEDAEKERRRNLDAAAGKEKGVSSESGGDHSKGPSSSQSQDVPVSVSSKEKRSDTPVPPPPPNPPVTNLSGDQGGQQATKSPSSTIPGGPIPRGEQGATPRRGTSRGGSTAPGGGGPSDDDGSSDDSDDDDESNRGGNGDEAGGDEGDEDGEKGKGESKEGEVNQRKPKVVYLYQVDISILGKVLEVDPERVIKGENLIRFAREYYAPIASLAIGSSVEEFREYEFRVPETMTSDQREALEAVLRKTLVSELTTDFVTRAQVDLLGGSLALAENGISDITDLTDFTGVLRPAYDSEKVRKVLGKLEWVKSAISLGVKAQMYLEYVIREFGEDAAASCAAGVSDNPLEWSIDEKFLKERASAALKRLGLIDMKEGEVLLDDVGEFDLDADAEILGGYTKPAPRKYTWDKSKEKKKSVEFLKSCHKGGVLKTYQTQLKLRPFESFWKNVRYFIKDNKMVIERVNDCIYTILFTLLLEHEFVKPSAKAVLDALAKDDARDDEGADEPEIPEDSCLGLINPALIERVKGQFFNICILVLGATMQGGWEEAIPWMDSINNVIGDYLTEGRLRTIIMEINGAETIPDIMEAVTVRDVRNCNEFFHYRFTRLATPALVRRATKSMPYRFILNEFPHNEIEDYRLYDEGGVVAQIASGPLKMYCTGTADPLRLGNLNDDLPLTALRAIPKAPYHPRSIRLAGVILKESKVRYGTWHQLKRAQGEDSEALTSFTALVRRTLELQGEESSLTDEQIRAMMKVSKSLRQGDAILKVTENWKKVV